MMQASAEAPKREKRSMSRPVAVITGSSTGIGAATAIRFAENGYNVVVNYSRDPAPALEVATICRKAGAEVETIKADVSADADCRMMAEMVEKRWGGARHLVNNAGRTKFVEQRNLDGLSAEDFQKATPHGFNVRAEKAVFRRTYANGWEFLRRLRKIGAHRAVPEADPLPAGALRKVLRATDAPFTVSYDVIYGFINR